MNDTSLKYQVLHSITQIIIKYTHLHKQYDAYAYTQIINCYGHAVRGGINEPIF